MIQGALIMLVDEWHGAYNPSAWRGLIVPAAFAHPAKFSRALIQRIYQHVCEEGWLAPGDTVLDMFGGVSLGGLDAGLRGIQHIAVEIEPRFHAVALENTALWQRRYGSLQQWVPPICLQGDSRRLQAMLRAPVTLCVSSPPYADGCRHTGGNDPQPQHIQGGPVHHVAYGMTEGQLGRAEDPTFWETSRQILHQTSEVLRAGGHALWVVKDYVRHGKRVSFAQQWRRVAESVGFVTLHEHHAMLLETVSAPGLFGEPVELYRVEHKSFFRRLAEKQGGPRIDHETVYCMHLARAG